jgi:hypothetical protein
MTPDEKAALALIGQTIAAPGSVTDIDILNEAMKNDDPQQGLLDITRSLIRISAGLMEVLGGMTPGGSIAILGSVTTAYDTTTGKEPRA